MSSAALPPTCFVLGAGRVGQRLALALPAAGYPVLGVWTRSAARAAELATFCALPVAHGPFPEHIRDATLVFLAVPDDAIASTVQVLLENQRLGKEQLLLHLSGALGLEALSKAAARGVQLGSLHPLRAFASLEPSAHANADAETVDRSSFAAGTDPKARAFAGALAVIEGDLAVSKRLQALATALGMHPTRLKDGALARAGYHAAAMMAAGDLIALVAGATRLACASGLPETLALPALLGLARSSLENLERSLSPAAAMTGPAVRGDEGTLALHKAAIAALAPELQESYAALLALSQKILRED